MSIKWRFWLAAWAALWALMCVRMIGAQTTCPPVTLGALDAFTTFLLVAIGAPLGAMALAEWAGTRTTEESR